MTGPAAAPTAALALVTDQPLDPEALSQVTRSAAIGASAVFTGIVRDHDHGRTVAALEYESHPSARQVLADVVAEIAAQPDVLGVAVAHRVGRLAIGDRAMVAVVAAAHRRTAFEQCARLVDEVKARVPIWKRQTYADGTDEWINCP